MLSATEKLCEQVEEVADVEILTPLRPSRQTRVEVTRGLSLSRIAPVFGKVRSIRGDNTTTYKTVR